ISIILNGKEIKINKQISVQQLLIKENLEKKMLAVAINGSIIERKDYEQTTIKEKDRIEIVRPVGGG
ncbi:MAG: sulfur carrier protein ThiS, partial [Chloroflexota bacterium]|nr:sulfur carrier protein ThiS [Chloroflexota bacterium]